MLLPHIPCQLHLQEIPGGWPVLGSPPSQPSLSSSLVWIPDFLFLTELSASSLPPSVSSQQSSFPVFLKRAGKLPTQTLAFAVCFTWSALLPVPCLAGSWVTSFMSSPISVRPSLATRLYGYTTYCLSIPHLMEIWVLSFILMLIFQRAILPPPTVSTLALAKCPNVYEMR